MQTSHVCTGLCGACCLPPAVGPKEFRAPDHRHLPSLIEIRKVLEETEHHTVHVTFDSGERPYTYTRRDLPAIRQKILFSM